MEKEKNGKGALTRRNFLAGILGLVGSAMIPKIARTEPRFVDDILYMDVAKPVYYPSEVRFTTEEGAEVTIKDLDGDGIIDWACNNYGWGQRIFRRNKSSVGEGRRIEKNESDPWFMFDVWDRNPGKGDFDYGGKANVFNYYQRQFDQRQKNI
ncbi:MAG: hypothetical protein ABIH49_00425 [archaeon]